MSDRIEGQVARILTDRRLVINRGEEHGVEAGMRFAILSDAGLDIQDPESGETLGPVEVAKTIVRVISTGPRLCTARTFRTVKSTGIFGSLTAATERTETLRTDEATAEMELDESDSKVKTGDRAVQVMADEFEGMILGF